MNGLQAGDAPASRKLPFDENERRYCGKGLLWRGWRLSPAPYFRHNLFSPRRVKHAGMQAYVYKSQRKQDTYLYLAKRDDFEAIPATLEATLSPFDA